MPPALELDLGPLTWVKGEIDAALARAASALDEAVRSSEGAPQALQFSQTHLHQVRGALSIVGLDGLTHFADTLDRLLGKLAHEELPLDQARADACRRALSALGNYLDELAHGAPDQPLRLSRLYAELALQAGDKTATAADLFFPDLSRRPPHHGQPVAPLDAAQEARLMRNVRASFEHGLLGWLRQPAQPAGAQEMQSAAAMLETRMSAPAARVFWWVCVGYFEALAKTDKLTPGTRQICTRLGAIMRHLPDSAASVPDRLLRDTLYELAIRPVSGPTHAAVAELFDLAQLIPEGGSSVNEAPLAPLLQRLRELLAETREDWNAFCGGSAAALPNFEEGLGRLAQAAAPLGRPAFTRLIGGLQKFCEWLRQDPLRHDEPIAMEVATAILLGETVLETGSVPSAGISAQVGESLDRLAALSRGEAPSSSVGEATTAAARRAQEREAMAQFGREILSSLNHVEQALDEFFRTPEERAPLAAARAPLAQIEGALHLLGDPGAIRLVRDAQATLDGFANSREAPTKEECESLAQRLSGLGFWVEAIQRGPADLQQIVEGRPSVPPAPAPSAPAAPAAAVAETAAPVARIVTGQPPAPKPEEVPAAAPEPQVAEPASVVAEPVPVELTQAEAEPPLPELVLQVAEAVPAQPVVASTAPAAAAPAPAVAPPAVEELDPELLEIFIEEARDVIATISEHLELSRREPSNKEYFTTIRRGFHTLKGSGRMVGLRTLGEAAWSLEQTLNRWLQLEWTPTGALYSLIGSAAGVFSEWVDQIAGSGATEKDASPLLALAEALRNCDTPLEALPELPPSARVELEQPAAIEIEAPTELPAAPEEAPAMVTEAVEEAPPLLATPEVHAEEAPAEAAPLEPALAEEAAFELSELSFEAQPVEAAEEPEPEPSSDLSDFELAATSLAVPELDITVAPEAVPEPEPEALPLASPLEEEEPEIEAIALEGFDEAEAPETAPVAEAAPEAAPETGALPPYPFLESPFEELGLEAEGVGMGAPAAVPPLEAPAEPPPAALEPVVAEAPLAQPEAVALEAAPQEEDEILLGDLHLSRTLFELFTAEAGQHVATLRQELAHLASNPTLLPSQASIRAAHTLGGIAGTARIDPIVPLARALEHVQNRFHEAQTPPSEEARALLLTAVETLHGMVSEVGQRSLPLPVPEFVEQLEQFARHALLESLPVEPPPAAAPAFEEVPAPLPATPVQPEAPAPQDELDEQLLPIFMEEAEDLMAQLATKVRQWRAEPNSAEPQKLIARLLHTLKGSARMAGAMTLGAYVHSLEGRLEEGLAAHAPQEVLIDELENGVDQCDAMIGAIGRGEPVTLPSAAPAPAAAAPAVVEAAAQPSMAHAVDTTIETPAPAAAAPEPAPSETDSSAAVATLRVRADAVDRFVNEAGEIGIARARIEGELHTLRKSLLDLTENVIRLRNQLREIEIQAEVQMHSHLNQTESHHGEFDPLEMDRYTRLQELTRMMAESVGDVTTVQQNLLHNLDGAEAALTAQARMSRDLQQALMRVRMVAFDSVADRLYRVVRQSAKDLGKRASLDIVGGRVEIDRGVLERMTAPLEHLLRNSVAHGIEDAETRRAKGKSEAGRITLELRQEGNEIALSLSDDGKGLDYQRILERARENGLVGKDEQVDERRLTNLIFIPGFSTAGSLSAVSGRGVGMDVVKAETAAVGGRIEVSSTAGQGSHFRIYLPLTLAVTQALLVQAGGRTYAIPSSMIAQVQELKADAVEAVRQSGKTAWMDQEYAYRYLPRLVGDELSQPEIKRFNWLLLLHAGAQTLALHVDNLRGNQEIVIKKAGPQLARIVGVTGATVLGDGEIVLILNPVALASRSLGELETAAPTAAPAAPAAPAAVQEAPLVMVVDDSLTVRKITTRFLEREGFRVLTAKDGVDALEKLIEAEPAVILSDIEMPRMDGFDLLRNIRADQRLKTIPVIMITSRLADKHRQYAEELGASHYLGKPYQEDELLELLQRYTSAQVSVAT